VPDPVAPSTPAPPPPSPPIGDRDPPPALEPIACKPGASGAPARRLWRLSGEQYRNALLWFFYGRKPTRPGSALNTVIAPFETASTVERFTNFAAAYTMTDFELRRVLLVGGEVASLYVGLLRGDDRSCLGNGPGRLPVPACVKAVAEQRGPILFNRPLQPAELEAIRKTVEDAVPMLGEDEAAALAFQKLFTSPHFLFRTEIGEGAANAAGQVRLSSDEVAAALAYALTDFPPDPELWNAAQSNQLTTTEQVHAQVARLLGTLGPTSETVKRFIREYFKYEGVMDVFKDVFRYRPDFLVRDTDNLVGYLLSQSGGKDFLKTLLTTEVTYASNWTAMHSGVPTTNWASQRYTFMAGQRSGILTQPSFLIAFSDPESNHPVQRGRFISESLLCRPVPDLPIGLVPVIPADPKMTLRERLAMHSKDACWSCHKLLDPLGLAFEQYDHLGRYRTTEAGKPVDASGEITSSGNQDGPFRNAVELMHKLASSTVVEECFTRHSFRFWLGRNEQAFDGCALEQARNAYQKSGGDLRALVAALFASASFVYRSAK
jgi:hypothetical protein